MAKQKGEDVSDVYQTSIIERYWVRPLQQMYEDMCLADFVVNYKVVKTKDVNEEDCDKESSLDEDVSTVVKLMDNKGYLKKRRKAAVFRYLRVSRSKDSERHFATLLRLYMPHRNKTMKSEDETYEEVMMAGKIEVKGVVKNVREIVVTNMDKYEQNAEVVDEAWSTVQGQALEDGWADVAPACEEERCEDEDAENDDQCVSDEDFEEVELPDLDQNLSNVGTSNCYGSERICCRREISADQALTIIRRFNKKQKEIFTEVQQWCKGRCTGKNVKPFHLFVTGGAGTGKSALIKGLRYEANRLLSSLAGSSEEILVLLVAYTGTAAFNIDGQTIHSAFAIHCDIRNQKYSPLGEEQVTRLREKYRNLQIVFIDEVSMVGEKMIMYIDERLKQIKQCQEPFGNVSVIAVGDFYQIPPVGDRALYNIDKGQLYESSWRLFKVWQLKEIMRQKEDLDFANLLNIIRTKGKDQNLSAEQKEMISTRCYTAEYVPDQHLHIYPRNKEVDEFNVSQLYKCSGVVTINAADIIHTRGNCIRKRTSPVNKPNSMLRASISVAQNARVMLTTNLDVTDGLCNGVMGTVLKISSTMNNMGQPQEMWILFDNERIGRNNRILNPPPSSIHSNCVKIVPHIEEFKFQNQNITRHQYPLRLAWACTIHKTQGMTLKSCVVSCKGTFLAGMQYVALSRATSLGGLYITDYDEKSLYCESKVSDALNKMNDFSVNHTPLLSSKATAPNITIIAHNIHSVIGHFEDLKQNSEMFMGDVIGLCETWLKKSDTSEYILPGYKTVRNDRADNSGKGGVLFYIRNGLHFRTISLESPKVLS